MCCKRVTVKVLLQSHLQPLRLSLDMCGHVYRCVSGHVCIDMCMSMCVGTCTDRHVYRHVYSVLKRVLARLSSRARHVAYGCALGMWSAMTDVGVVDRRQAQALQVASKVDLCGTHTRGVRGDVWWRRLLGYWQPCLMGLVCTNL